MSNITQPSDRFLLTSDFAGSVTGDSATAVTPGDFSSAGRTGEFNMPASFGALMRWETGDGSFSFWTTLSSATNRHDYIANDTNGADYPDAGALLFNNHTGTDFTFYYHQPPAGHTYPSVSTVGWAVGNPIHVMLVKDSAAGDMKVYVNGVLENTSAWPSAAWGNADDRQWRFGGYNGTGTFDWPGSIADVAVWDGIALSSAEVSAIYNAGQGGEWTSGVAGVRKFKKRFWLSYDDGSYSIRAASSASDAPGLSLTLESGPRRGRETVEILNADKALVGIGKTIHVVTAPEGTGNSSLSASHDLSGILPEFGSECQFIRKKKNNPGIIFMLDETGKLFKAQSNDGWDTISSANLVRDLTLDGFPTNVVDLSSDNNGRVIAIGKGDGNPTVTFVDADAGTTIVTSTLKPELAALSKVWDINYFADSGTWYAADGAIPGPQTIISTDDITNWFDGTSMAAPSFAMPSTFASLVADLDSLNGASYNVSNQLLQVDDQSGNNYHMISSDPATAPIKVSLNVNDTARDLPAGLVYSWTNTVTPPRATINENMTDFTIAMIIPTYQFTAADMTNYGGGPDAFNPTYNTYLSVESLAGYNELRFVTENTSGQENTLWIRNYWNATQMETDIGYHPDNGLGANAIVIFRRDTANNITKVDTWYNKDDGSATVRVPQATASDFITSDAGVGAILMGLATHSGHYWRGGHHRASLFNAALSDAEVLSLAQGFADVVGMDGVE